MSLSNEWYEFHLTPAGWVKGSEKLDGAGEKGAPTPADRTLTLRFHDYQSHTRAKCKRRREEVWRSDDAALVKLLIQKFGRSPETYMDYGKEK